MLKTSEKVPHLSEKLPGSETPAEQGNTPEHSAKMILSQGLVHFQDA